MSILTCPVPETINPLQANQYIFSVNKIPSLTFFAQSANLPDLTLGSQTMSTRINDIKMPGDSLEFGSLMVRFTVDEKFKNYKAVAKWMIALGFPEDNQQFSRFIVEQQSDLDEYMKTVSDATLGILDSANNPVATITFIDCFPVSLSGLEFDSEATQSSTIKATAVFEYTHYKMTTIYD